MIRGLLVTLLVCATAQADTIVELPKTKARLEILDGWTRAEHPNLVVAYKSPAGSTLVVSRMDVPNGDAWSKDAKTREAHADAIERGIAKTVPDYKRTKRTLARVNNVPTLDLEATRKGGATLVMRVLLFRTYVLALGIETAKQPELAVARSIATKFGPPPSSK